MVEILLGKKEQISFSDVESPYGTAATPVEILARNASFDPSRDNQNIIPVKGASTDVLDVPVREFGQETWGGTLSYVPQNWKFLKFVLLAEANKVTDTAPTPYTHTFTNTKTGLASFTLERAIQATTSRVRRYEGCQVDNYALSWDASDVGSYLNATATVFAEDGNNGTSVTSLVAPTTEGYKPRYTALTLEGSSVAYLRSGTFTINNGLTDGMYADSSVARLKKESAPILRTFNLTAVAQYEDDTFFDMLDSADILGSTNTLVFQRAANDNLTVTFTGAYLNTAPDPTNLEGANTVNLNIDINSAAFVAVDTLSDYVTFT